MTYTSVAKYSSFQYRLLMRAIVINVHLHRWNIIRSSACSLCREADVAETVEHLFWRCPATQRLWTGMMDMCNVYDICTFTEKTVLLSQVSCNCQSVSNLICTIYKQYVYRQRCLKQDIIVEQFRSIVNTCINIENTMP